MPLMNAMESIALIGQFYTDPKSTIRYAVDKRE